MNTLQKEEMIKQQRRNRLRKRSRWVVGILLFISFLMLIWSASR